MAGDWIKMRADLHTHPKVVRIASALKADRLRVIGGLHAVWCLFGAHSVDGRLDYTTDALDEEIRWPGLAQAMAAPNVEWLIIGDGYLELPRFQEHNGQSAKRRAQEADRKREVRKASAPDADKKRTREEKRREDKGVGKPTPTTHAATKPQKLAVTDLIADGLDEQTALELLALRRKHRAELTPRAWEAIKREAASISWSPAQAVEKMLARGWRGFEAAWITKDIGGQFPVGGSLSKQEQLEQHNADIARRWAQKEQQQEATQHEPQ